MGANNCCWPSEKSTLQIQHNNDQKPLYQYRRVNPLAQTENIPKGNQFSQIINPKTVNYSQNTRINNNSQNSGINNYPTTQKTNNNPRFSTMYTDFQPHNNYRPANSQPQHFSRTTLNKQIVYTQSNNQPVVQFKYQQGNSVNSPKKYPPANSTFNTVSRAQTVQNYRRNQSSQSFNQTGRLAQPQSNINFVQSPSYNTSSNPSRISQQRKAAAFKLNPSQIDKNQYFQEMPSSLRQSTTSQQDRDQINRRRKQIQQQTDPLQKIQKRIQLASEAFSIDYQQFAERQFNQIIDQIQKNNSKKSEEQDALAYASASLANIYIIIKKDIATIRGVARKALVVYQQNPSNYLEQTITLKNNLALAYENQKLFSEAIKLYKEVLILQDKFYSINDQRRLSTLNNLFCLYSQQKDRKQAQNTKNIIMKDLNQVDKKSTIYQIFLKNLDHYSKK